MLQNYEYFRASANFLPNYLAVPRFLAILAAATPSVPERDVSRRAPGGRTSRKATWLSSCYGIWKIHANGTSMKKLFSLLCIYSVVIIMTAPIYAAGVSCRFILTFAGIPEPHSIGMAKEAHTSVYISERE